MKKYDIFYENIEDKENYLKILAQLLKQQLNISFHINGLIIELTPGMNEEEILNEITKKIMNLIKTSNLLNLKKMKAYFYS